MKRYPNYIVHFDNGDALEHFGIPGMKWGIRKAYKYAGTHLASRKGDRVRRLASGAEKLNNRFDDVTKRLGVSARGLAKRGANHLRIAATRGLNRIKDKVNSMRNSKSNREWANKRLENVRRMRSDGNDNVAIRRIMKKFRKSRG
jgi:hypothetical protein